MQSPEACKDMPLSVSSRLRSQGCKSVDEAIVTARVAGAACGGFAALVASLHAFVIPVQCPVPLGVEDVLRYLLVGATELGVAPRPFYGSRPYLVDNHVKSAVTWDEIQCARAAYQKLLTTDYSVRDIKSTSLLDPEEDWWFIDSFRTWWRGKGEREIYPTKKLGYDHKINLWFKDVWHDCVRYRPELAYCWGQREPLSRGMFNDEATGWLIWLSCLKRHELEWGLVICEFFSRDTEFLKELNIVLKAAGVQATGWGPKFCELSSLAGRGVKIPEPAVDIAARIDEEAFLREKGVKLDLCRLKRCIKRVLRAEIAAKPEWGSVSDYWTHRWAFTKSGSHSRYPEERWFGHRLELPELPTRREFAEAVREPLVAYGAPRVDAGYSMKLEHGKTRAIYGCDTGSYFTFDYLLRPVEAVWRNQRIMLDPGRLPQSVLYKKLANKPGVRYMIDFDDFNSQHTLDAMKACIELACEGAPPDVLKWALESWDNLYVHWPTAEGVKEARMVGTLPSGHRATTFINTILNAAYCMYAIGDDYDSISAYHVGDDVFMVGPDQQVSAAVAAVLASPFRINPAKQSVGREVGEFLRVAFTRDSASGYVARAVSSLVSGNWVTESQVDRRSYVENAVRSWWTISARAGGEPRGALGVTSLTRWVPEIATQAHDILHHALSIDGSPLLARTAGSGVTVLRLTGGTERRKYDKPKYTYATDDYMSNHVDVKLLEAAGVPIGRLHRMMLEASYKPVRRSRGATVEVIWDRAFAWVDFSLSALLTLYEREGKSQAEAYQLLRSVYKDVDWRRIIAGLRGVDMSTMSTDGKCPWPVLSHYEMPFSDAMRLRRRLTTVTAVYTTYPVRV